MIVLVVGTSDSGKSATAESIVCNMAGGDKRIYIATMIPYGDEGKRRIERHRLLRNGKGFVTIEKPYDIADVASGIMDVASMTGLLECVANLVGNELHDNPKNDGLAIEQVIEHVICDIVSLAGRLENLVVVTNHFDMQDDYDEDTRKYIEAMKLVNDRLMDIADKIVDVRKMGD